VTETVGRILRLLFHPYMTTEDVDYVMSVLPRTLVGVRDTTSVRIAEYRAQNQIGCLRAE
jgi:uncharacterized membrane protein